MKTGWQKLPDNTALLCILLLCWGWPLFGSLYYSYFPPSGGIRDMDLWTAALFEVGALTLTAGLLHWRNWRTSDFPITIEGRALAWALALLLALGLLNFLISASFATLGINDPRHANPNGGSISLPAALLFALINGTFEELVLFGILRRALQRYGWPTIIVISCVLRALAHLYQGPAGALTMAAYGALNGYVYWRTGNLWPLILAHIMADAIGLIAVALTVNAS